MPKYDKVKTILITGLDGSGKSTLLSKLEKNSTKKDVKIVLLPKIEEDNLKNNKQLYKVAKFVNYLNLEADVKKLPQLKAIALFSSMLLFKKINAQIIDKNTKTIFYERHPLIDTGVYARFYAEKLKPGSIAEYVLKELDNNFSQELDYILNLLPDKSIIDKTGKSRQLISFIFQKFHLEGKYDFKSLKQLFNIDLPDEIYYLKADADILFQRINKREILEAHESVEILGKLGTVYDALFNELNSIKSGLVYFADANNLNNLNDLYKKLK